jgi:hypothetical protein
LINSSLVISICMRVPCVFLGDKFQWTSTCDARWLFNPSQVIGQSYTCEKFVDASIVLHNMCYGLMIFFVMQIYCENPVNPLLAAYPMAT